MTTLINGFPARWTSVVRDLWKATESERAEGKVHYANFFTTRPCRSEYDRGRDTEGFTYIIGSGVWILEWARSERMRILTQAEPEVTAYPRPSSGTSPQ